MAPLLTAEQLELRDSFRSFIAEHLPLSIARRNFENPDTDLSNQWQKLLELGVLQYFSESSAAGGGSLRELGLLASECGYGLLSLNLIESALVTRWLTTCISPVEAKGVEELLGSGWRTKLSAGTSRCAFIPKTSLPVSVSDDNQQISIAARFVSNALSCSAAILIDRTAAKVWLCTLDSSQMKREVTLDSTEPRFSVSLTSSKAVLLPSLIASKSILEWLALKSCELAGAARRALELTVEYVKVREQFEVPVGGFQAVQHAAADMLLKVEGMQALSDFACWTVESSPDQTELSSRSAALFCAAEGPKVVEKAIQLHGGIGFTWEHDLHLLLRRVRFLASLIVPDEIDNQRLVEVATQS